MYYNYSQKMCIKGSLIGRVGESPYFHHPA